jgi:hypothetical protein
MVLEFHGANYASVKKDLYNKEMERIKRVAR